MPISYDFRIKIIEGRKSGKTFDQIAEQYGFSVSGVKKIWRQFQLLGEPGLQPQYSHSGRPPVFAEQIKELIALQKTGQQGGPFIRSVLEDKYPELKIPHERTMQRWWQSQGINRPKGRRKKNNSNWSNEVHHTWQIDGKEQISLGNGQEVSWMNIADEASSSNLLARVFPPTDDESVARKGSGSGDQ